MNNNLKNKTLTTPSEELFLCDNFSISSSGFVQKAELAKGSEPLMPQAIVVLQSLSLPVAPAHETEAKTILILFLWLSVTPGIGWLFVHPIRRQTINPSFYELSSHYNYTSPDHLTIIHCGFLPILLRVWVVIFKKVCGTYLYYTTRKSITTLPPNNISGLLYLYSLFHS